MDQYKYWAFISYSHADERWARWLHRALEGYRIPARLVGQPTPLGPVPRKLFPVFRDRDELAGSSELGPELESALKQSRFQIVVASPRAAQSHWTNEEIRRFKSLGRSARVLALIVDGEPGAAQKGQPEQECFPPALRFQVESDGTISDRAAEPVGADVRKGTDGKGNAKLKLIAGILGLPFDELRQRELHARNRRLAIVAGLASAVAAVTIALAVVAYHARNDAVRAEQLAQQRQQQAEDLLQFMLGDLRDKLEPIGKLAILDAVGKKAMDYFATLGAEDVTDNALASRATALHQIGQVRTKQGDMTGATASFLEALKLDEELVRRHPTNAVFLRNVGESESAMGVAYYLKGEIAQARPWFERYLGTARRLSALQPQKREWRSMLVDASANLGGLQFAGESFDAARDSYRDALAQQEALLAEDPDNRAYLVNLADLQAWMSNIEAARRDYAAALAQARSEAAVRARLAELEPENAGYRFGLSQANLHVLYAQSQLEALAPSDRALAATLSLSQELVTLDPENIQYADTRIVALNYAVDAQVLAGRTREAAATADEMLAFARRTYQRAPANAGAIDDLLGALAQAAKLSLLRRDARGARAHIDEAQALPLTDDQRSSSSAARWLDLRLLAWWTASDKARAAALQAEVVALLKRLGAAASRLKPELMMRYAALSGDAAQAGKQYAQLSDLERQHPFLQQFCRETQRCGSQGPAAAPAAEPAGLVPARR